MSIAFCLIELYMGDNETISIWKVVGILGGILLTDFFLFPLAFAFFPYGNTKIYMALAAIIILLFRGREFITEKGSRVFIILCCYALSVSFVNFISIVVNNTPDYTYVSYIISMLVWLGGAFSLVCYLDNLHDGLSVRVIAYYLLTVCALQCISALLIDNNVGFYNVVCQLIKDQKGTLEYADGRLCGISCAFDPAGIRFSAVLVISLFLLPKFLADKDVKIWSKTLFLIGIAIVVIVGNMISRTTTVGAIMGMAYVLYAVTFGRMLDLNQKFSTFKWLLIILIVTIPTVAYLYNTNYNFREELRFGFEGFFSLAESGEWNVHSNNVLENMVVLPDNLKTWLVGDGFFIDTTQDPYYVGKTYEGYYMNTDIGYLRFIFYFGLIGLLTFTAYFIYVTKACISFFPKLWVMFLALLMLQFIVWFKVATDIFPIFAIFLSWGFIDSKTEYETEKVGTFG